MKLSAEICCDAASTEKSGEEILAPPPGWEAILWRALISVGLLLASFVIGRNFKASVTGGIDEDGDIISGLIAFTAALIMGIPLFKAGLAGLFTNRTSAILDQIAALAVLASMVMGDFTSAVVVALALDLGHLAEERGIKSASAAIESLIKLSARISHRISDSSVTDIKSDHLEPGDHILIFPGEVVPADCNVVSGHSAIDPAHLTGESTPLDVSPGDEIYHGTINLTGRLEAKVNRVSSDTTLGRVIDALSRSEASRPPMVRILERYAGMLLPIVILISAAVFVFTRDASRAIAVLIVTCPCALVLSSPAAIIPALAVAVRRGILIKGGAFLECAANVSTLILDKTGTITVGELTVLEYVPVAGVSVAELTDASLIAASGSHHPISQAIARNGKPEIIGEAVEIPGKGIEVMLDGAMYRLGRLKWVTNDNKDADELESVALAHSGPSTWVGRNGRLLGLILLSDQLRPDAKEALESMKKLGVRRCVLLTGDRADVANKLAAKVGFDRVESGVLPEAKNDVVEEEIEMLRSSEDNKIKEEGAVMFIGDGVNDALALARADVGIALGAMGSEVALQSADIALMSNDLSLVPWLVELSREVHKVIKTNVTVGVGFSIFMLLLAMLGIISPIWGAVLHHGGTLFVIGNSMRLLNEDSCRSTQTHPG